MAGSCTATLRVPSSTRPWPRSRAVRLLYVVQGRADREKAIALVGELQVAERRLKRLRAGLERLLAEEGNKHD